MSIFLTSSGFFFSSDWRDIASTGNDSGAVSAMFLVIYLEFKIIDSKKNKLKMVETRPKV
jgi:hypothetical protein